MKKRLFRLSLPLLVVIAGVFLVGRAYQSASRQTELNYALVTAVKKLDVHAVQSLLSEGADANTNETAGQDLGFIHYVKLLLTRWKPNSSFASASPSALQILMKNAWEVGYGRNMLSDYDAIGEALTSHGADTHFGIGEWRALREATAHMGMPRTLQSQLARGEAAEVKGANGLSTLLGARGECMAILLRAGANPNASAQDGTTPLLYAVETDDLESVRALLDGRANPNSKDKEGHTPLMFAGEPEIAKLLIQHGANVNARDKDGQSVLVWAEGNTKLYTMEDNRQVIALLKRRGAKE